MSVSVKLNVVTRAPAWRRYLVMSLVLVMVAVAVAGAARGADAAGAGRAREILAATGVTGGLVVHLGCGDGALTAALGAGEGFLVQGLDARGDNVARARRAVRAAGRYGPVAIDQLTGDRLPLADNIVRLVVADDLGPVPMGEVMRVLCPDGVAYVKRDGRWVKTVKPLPGEIDEWTHYFHGADGNPVAHDTVVGPPRRLQWAGGPRWARHHDHMASMTSLVSAGGRLFYIFDEGLTASIQLPSKWRLIARDAFGGAILWKRTIDQWNTRQWPLKSGPAHLTRRLVAVDNRVYVTLSIEAPVTALDAATGKTVLTYAGSERTREIIVSDGMLLAVIGTGASKLPDWRRRHSYVWDNTRRANADWAWTGQKRLIAAYDAASGKKLWQSEAPVSPCSLAADGGRVIFHDGAKVVCLARKTGKRLWASEPVKTAMPVQTNTGPRTLIHADVVLTAGNTGQMTALSADSGKTLWQAKHEPSGHQSLKDLMVVRGIVWTAPIAQGNQSGTYTGRDVRTGKVVSTFPEDVRIYWFHHRCYPAKATDNFLLTSRNGIEFVDPRAKHWQTHHWVRGGCIYGIMPCNGLVYAPMNSCGCYLESKLHSFNALAPGKRSKEGGRRSKVEGQRSKEGGRLEKGPAFGKNPQSAIRNPQSEWSTYRHDASRSGATSARVPADLKQAWRAVISGRLSPPVIAGGRVFVAAIDAHTVHAIDAASGKVAWSYTAGARVDSPPTIYRGLALFGSADGYVYAVSAAEGKLAWRFRAAPADERIVAHEQVESVWPVHGSVLVEDGVLYLTAGRSIFLDGGIRMIRLDPATGTLLGQTLWDERDPSSGKNMQVHVKGLHMPVALSDVLSSDGTHLYMRSQRIDKQGRRLEIPVQDVNSQPADGAHLFCQIGFLDDSWFHRSYWTYGRRVSGGYGAWLLAGRVVPAGRILTVDDKTVYGYGRKPEYYVNASVLEHHLFAADKHVTKEAIARLKAVNTTMNRRSSKRNANSSDWKLRREFGVKDLTAARYAWQVDQPSLQVRAMLAAADALVVAGPPDFIDERRAYRLPDDPGVIKALERQAEAIVGKHGGQLWIVDKATGKPGARYRLASPPVFDGLAAAGGKLVMCAVDGSVVCLASEGTAVLPRIADGESIHTISDEPKEPSVLRPAEVDAAGAFDKVAGCRVVKCKLGYRLRPKGSTKTTGVALQKLKTPLAGAATLATTLNVPGEKGFLVNGFVAFGQGPAEAKLIKCGIRFQPQKASIVLGSLTDKATGRGVDIKAPVGKPVTLTVRVDLAARTVTLTAGAVTVSAKLPADLKRITHVGFCMDNAVADFAPLKIKRE